MSVINVDIDTIASAKQIVQDYIDYQKTQTNQTSLKIEEMGECWKGTDYERLKNKWTELTNSSSISTKTSNELSSFWSYLDRCQLEYGYLQSGLRDVATSYLS